MLKQIVLFLAFLFVSAYTLDDSRVLLSGTITPVGVTLLDELLDGTTIRLAIENYAEQHVPSKMLAERVVELSKGSKFPIRFNIYLSVEILQQILRDNRHVVLTVRIEDTATKQLLYSTDVMYKLKETGDLNIDLKVRQIAKRIEKPFWSLFYLFFVSDDKPQSSQNDNVKQIDASSSKTEICSLKSDTGPCKAATTRYYYDILSNTCKEFLYGGCKGNKNNFASIDECLSTCKPTV